MAAPEAAPRQGPRRQGFGKALVAVGVFAGAGMLALAMITAPDPPPQPDGVVDAYHDGFGRVLARSVPIAITIPAIEVRAEVIAMGVAANGAIDVPPLEMPGSAGWYRYGPSPGEPGSAVIVGHVDSRSSGPAVFYRLGALRHGDLIEVRRDDGATAVFTVDGATTVPKDAFPAAEVHTRTGPARLTVITCGGRFDRKNGSYLDNVIVYATLTALR
ncbi:sortase (surface protein transpeptidase) [Allocatelliglobosispora scoriae]|uniref:Sortase (Surface protein transpeptidase) n=1 Tax=Allocatelliglobosispora scoriae TaxID=643052 RepID=A0A841C5F5_9ACTN|nr:class F sortase [Allocatelliglobosispora scoriae]MBB5874041.1 sortase (surface protein transpeptidase) [Allocatelliglobosispora scoriae]